VQVTQDKRMELCKICGAYLVIGDTEKRKLSHLEGKQHKGYELIRNKIDEYYNKKEAQKNWKKKEVDLVLDHDLVLEKFPEDQNPEVEVEKEKDITVVKEAILRIEKIIMMKMK